MEEKPKTYGYCPVHQCEEIKELKTDLKKKLPVWVFTFFGLGVFSIIGWLNVQSIQSNKETVALLKEHLEQTDQLTQTTANVLKKMMHNLNEVTLNQRLVIKKLELEFQSIPSYEDK